ncbi:methyl-accepting chemotaxis protein [Chitinimonas sp. BJYL2]|uniref:methyl-accepting chemotaxis protein n=1 Tax=Chitinimonas sp. BJYL2 TaxID=2976696 RepID=UPI0022B5B9DF|nr:methyl-accepting chemotaxis protein [Chitinimonas sp. BJYL2]
MTLRAKLIGLVAGLIALMVMLAISSLMTLAATNEDFASTYNDRIVPLKQLKVVADMYAVNIVDTTHKLNHQSMDPAAAQASYAAAKAGISEQWKAYTATKLTDEEKVLVSRAETAMAKADELVRQLEAKTAAKDMAGIDTLARQQLYPVIDPVSTAISELVDLQLREAKKGFDTAQEDYASVRTWTVIKLFVALALGIGVAFWIVTTMNTKISTLNRIMRQARDNNDLTLRIPQHNQDEIDSVARAYNALADNMQSLIRTVAVAVDSVNGEAEQLASTSEQVAQATNLGSEATSSMAAAVEEVTVSIAHVADSAKEAHEVGEASRLMAQQGGAQIQATIERIHAIDGAVASTADKVTALGKDAERITSVVSVIKDVADQTNLLALNAAIEAARAGEQGRGFAVVADEVRKLAERTANATVDIQNMVGQIGANSQQAVAAIAATVERAHECAMLASEAGSAIASITRDVDAGEHAVAVIAEALNEHKAGTQQIAQQVERVAQITEENTAAVATMSQTATNLGDLTRRLHAEIRRFRYDAGGA